MDKDVSRLGHVGVLMGGCSSEREISLKSGKAVYEALQGIHCRVSPIDITTVSEEEISALIRKAKIDVAFIALHGRLGEDGAIQMILERIGIPYPGSGVEASRIAISKAATQRLLSENNIPVSPFRIIKKNNIPSPQELFAEFGSAWSVVKPAEEGSSIGISLVRGIKDFPPALEAAFRYGDEVLIERYIKGRELTVGILAEEPLPVIEIRPKGEFFDFTSKYQSGMTEYIIPAQIPEGVAHKMQEIALKTHRIVGCRDFSRIDIMLSEDNQPCVLEVNTIPGFTSTSLLPKAAKCQGIDFAGLCVKLIQLAYAKQK